jgi:hypothetical protein
MTETHRVFQNATNAGRVTCGMTAVQPEGGYPMVSTDMNHAVLGKDQRVTEQPFPHSTQERVGHQ